MTTREALYDTVYANPDDVDARRVLADFLLEEGDPRGELIALQTREAPLDKKGRDRVRSLLTKHRKEWLGALANVLVLREGLVFEGGFLTECAIATGDPRKLERVIGDRAWSTVESIAIRHHVGDDFPDAEWGRAPTILATLLAHPVLRSCRTIAALKPDVVGALLAAGASLSIERGWFGGGGNDTPTNAPVIRELLCFPRLRALGWQVIFDDLAWLLTSPVMRRIETFGVALYGRNTAIAPWPQRIARAAPHLRRIEVRPGWAIAWGPWSCGLRFVFDRQSDGAFTSVHVGDSTGRGFLHARVAESLRTLDPNRFVDSPSNAHATNGSPRSRRASPTQRSPGASPFRRLKTLQITVFCRSLRGRWQKPTRRPRSSRARRRGGTRRRRASRCLRCESRRAISMAAR